MDETGWREKGRWNRLWTAVVAKGLCVFRIAASRGRDAFEELMGRSPAEVVTWDRSSAYSHLKVEKRQICRAHLRRNFQSMIDRGGGGKGVGARLLHFSGFVIAWGGISAARWAAGPCGPGRRINGATVIPSNDQT